MYFRIKNKDIKIITFLLIILFLPSCAKEQDELGSSKPIDGKVQIALQLPSVNTPELRSTATDEETLVTNLSLFIFESATGNKEFSIRIDVPYTGASGDIDMSRWVSDQVIMVLNSVILSDLDKSRNIHIVSNIAANKLASVTNESSLEAVITDAIAAEIAEPDADKPLLMHGVKKDHNFITDVRASISLVRNVAKVNMTVNTTDFTFGGVKYLLAPVNQNLSVKMANVADRSYIVSALASPTTANYISYDFKTVTPSERGVGTTKSTVHSYINENLRTTYDVEKDATFVVLQIPYQKEGDVTVKTENYYKILINQENGYKINRNTIYDITLNISSLGGETDASAKLINGTLNILPWDENTIISDISQTFLTVKETVFNMGVSKDFYYATNAETGDCSLESGASWLTASFDATNNIKLTATGADYTVPRSTTLKIKVKNLTKVITVNQTPIITTGSITLNPQTIYISESPTFKDVTLTVDPTTSSWMKIDGDASIASCNYTTGTGNQTLRFTRGGTYDNTIYKFLNKSTLEYDEVKVCNLRLSVTGEEIGIPGDGGAFTESDLAAYGGDANWVVKSKSNWITSASNIGGELHFTAGAEPNELDRTGSIIIAHVNDLNYTKEIKINQSAKYVRFPEFDYLVIRYLWGAKPSGVSGWDVDTATELTSTSVTGLDQKPVGWSMLGSNQAGVPVKYQGYDILEWGGDNTSSGYECAFVNMYNLCNTIIYNELPRYFNVDLYSTWFTSGIKPRAINVEITLYKGGTMSRVNTYDYANSGGVQVYQETIENVNIITEKGAGTFRTLYTKIGTVRYDKMKNNATFTLNTNNLRSFTNQIVYPAGVSLDPLPGETKEECEKRLSKYRKQ